MRLHLGENAGYFAWSCHPDGSKGSDGPAPDGEEFFAMALFFASHRWGDAAEPFNYSEQARQLLSICLHKGKDGIGYPMWNPVGLIATNAMASLAGSGPHARAAVEQFWNTPLRTGSRRYYDNCLYLFSLLALSGNYRIWLPPTSQTIIG